MTNPGRPELLAEELRRAFGEEGVDPSKIRVRRYPLIERNGLIWIYIAQDPASDAAPVTDIPALPIELDGRRLTKRSDPPEIGEHGAALLHELGYSPQDIAGLAERRIVALPARRAT